MPDTTSVSTTNTTPSETTPTQVDINPKVEVTRETTVPVLKVGEPLTAEYVMHLDKAISSDGCTGVSDFYRDCCVIHDLAYRGGIDPWGQPITRHQANINFRQCIQSRSTLGRFSPMSWIRWAGVEVFGRFFYNPSKL